MKNSEQKTHIIIYQGRKFHISWTWIGNCDFKLRWFLYFKNSRKDRYWILSILGLAVLYYKKGY